MNYSNDTDTMKIVSRNELELEYLTKKYIIGEMELEQYRKEVDRLKPRLDLRKVVSRLRPILGSLPNNPSK